MFEKKRHITIMVICEYVQPDKYLAFELCDTQLFPPKKSIYKCNVLVEKRFLTVFL